MILSTKPHKMWADQDVVFPFWDLGVSAWTHWSFSSSHTEGYFPHEPTAIAVTQLGVVLRRAPEMYDWTEMIGSSQRWISVLQRRAFYHTSPFVSNRIDRAHVALDQLYEGISTQRAVLSTGSVDLCGDTGTCGIPLLRTAYSRFPLYSVGRDMTICYDPRNLHVRSSPLDKSFHLLE